MKVKKRDIGKESLLNQFLPADYTDSFEITTDSPIKASVDDIYVTVWTDMPAWINWLFKVRNFLVKFVGLKGSDDGNAQELEKCIREGGTYGFVEVPQKTESETVVVMRDKHLDAYMSVEKRGESSIAMNTLVHYNNTLGKVYFFFIRPFHGVVVRSILKRAVKKNK